MSDVICVLTRQEEEAIVGSKVQLTPNAYSLNSVVFRSIVIDSVNFVLFLCATEGHNSITGY